MAPYALWNLHDSRLPAPPPARWRAAYYCNLVVKIGVSSETLPGERRVALVPDGAGKLAGLGFEVHVLSGAGAAAGFCDQAYRDAAAAVDSDRSHVLGAADVLLAVQPPAIGDVALLKPGAVTISFLEPATHAA